MKHTLPLLLLLLLLMPLSLTAQQHTQHPSAAAQLHGQHFDFESFLQAKCDFVVTQLGLTPQESAKFLPVYREMMTQKSRIYHKYGGVGRVRRSFEQGQAIADTTLMRCVNSYAQRQVEDAKLELQYLEKLKTVLTPAQLFKLQQAEQIYKTEVMRRPKPARK